jgi:hypothetical protein
MKMAKQARAKVFFIEHVILSVRLIEGAWSGQTRDSCLLGFYTQLTATNRIERRAAA